MKKPGSRAPKSHPKSAETGDAPLSVGQSFHLPQSQHFQPAVRRTILALRTDSFALEPGTLLGAEDDLIKRYGVSRPTLRQAAGLVVQEQLIKVRRGVGGGYFADRPTFTAVAHMAAVFLQSCGTTLEEILRSIAPIRVELVRLAAINPDPAPRAAWRAFLAEEDGQEVSYRSFLRRERQFGELLGTAAGNNVLNLFLQTGLELVATSVNRDKDIFVNRQDRVEEATARRARVIEAILEGDPEIAVLEARRSAKASSGWLAEDAVAAAKRPAGTTTAKKAVPATPAKPTDAKPAPRRTQGRRTPPKG